VYDCHAEVLARRSFKLWLLREYQSIHDNCQVSKFFAIGENSKLIQQPNVKFFLYVSSAPCGNACIRRWGHSAKEVFRADLESLEVPVDRHPPFHAFAKHEGQVATSNKGESRILSCSDKILKWNIMGLQGTRLRSLVDKPIHLDGIIIGRKYVSVHARRAFCCRMDTKGIPKQIRQHVHHPVIMCTAVKFDEGVFAASDGESAVFDSKSIWWIKGDIMERLDGTTGTLHDNGGISKLCRQKLKALISFLGIDDPSTESLRLKTLVLEHLQKL
jgi:double-stranded RNA-specific adenosine deaminase